MSDNETTSAMEKLRGENAALKEVVKLALETRGTGLDWDKDICEELKQDGELAAVAVANDHVTWSNLPESCRTHPDVILAALDPGQIVWGDVPQDLQQNNQKIALFGVRKSLIDPDDCPCLLDRTFVKEQFLGSTLQWGQFPTELKTDIEFARTVILAEQGILTTNCACQILLQFPLLRGDRVIWAKVVDIWDPESPLSSLFSAIANLAPPEIRSDRELMIKACGKDHCIMRLADESIARRHDFLLAVAGRNARILREMSHELQRRFPDVVDRALRQAIGGENRFASVREFDLLSTTLAPEFWDNRDFLLRWFQLGLPFCTTGPFRRVEWTENREFFILIARHCNRFRRESFHRVSTSLRREKKFMLEVLEIDPSLFYLVASPLRNDFDLCLLCFSGDSNALEADVASREFAREAGFGSDQYDYLDIFRSQVSRRLNAHNTFTTIVLPAISQPTESGCALAVLNQGAETSRAYKKRMAEYLDIPTGKRLRLHRQTSHNLNEVLGSDNDE